MDPVFLYVNASRHILKLENAIEKLSTSEHLEAHESIRAEGIVLSRILPFLRRSLACYLCGGVLHEAVLVLECFHWSCGNCRSMTSTASSSSSVSGSVSVASVESAATPSHAMTASGSNVATGGGLGGSRRRSIRSGDLATYARRCRWCELKHTKVPVETMRILSCAYHRLCSVLAECKRHLDNMQENKTVDRKTRSSDVRGSLPLLWRLVAESTDGSEHLDDDDLPSGIPADDMFTGEYLRLKSQAKGPGDRLLLGVTSALSMCRYPRELEKRENTSGSQPAQQSQPLTLQELSMPNEDNRLRAAARAAGTAVCATGRSRDKNIEQLRSRHDVSYKMRGTMSPSSSSRHHDTHHDSPRRLRSRRLRSRHRTVTSAPYSLPSDHVEIRKLIKQEVTETETDLNEEVVDSAMQHCTNSTALTTTTTTTTTTAMTTAMTTATATTTTTETAGADGTCSESESTSVGDKETTEKHERRRLRNRSVANV